MLNTAGDQEDSVEWGLLHTPQAAAGWVMSWSLDCMLQRENLRAGAGDSCLPTERRGPNGRSHDSEVPVQAAPLGRQTS